MSFSNLSDLSVACRHPITVSRGSVEIEGFPFRLTDHVFSQIAYGNSCPQYGIAEGSILLCCSNADISDGDLVLVNGSFQPVIGRYFTSPSAPSDGRERIICDKNEVSAKIVAAFNIYR